MQNLILLAALDYLARGWSVVPVQGKQPLERWQRWQHERMTTRQAESLFSRPEVTGVAVVCGQVSDLMVLDFDGQIGRNAFLELYGNGLIELERPTVTTGSGGKHLYFALEPWAKTIHWHHQGLRAGELRADGGYVLAPPSCHPNGTLYSWDVEPLELLQVMPQTLREMLATPNTKTTQGSSGRSSIGFIEARGRLSYLVLLEKAKGEVQTLGRNNAGFRLATWLRDNQYSQSEAQSIVLEFAAQVQNGKHEYTDTEALASVRSAYSRPPRAPWGMRVSA